MRLYAVLEAGRCGVLGRRGRADRQGEGHGASGDLKVVNPQATILRHACTACGTHLYGPVEKAHAFQGLSFIHPERFVEAGAPAPGFAAFVSSVIEGGVDPSEMAGIRDALTKLGLHPYDCLNHPLMDALATFAAKQGAAKQGKS